MILVNTEADQDREQRRLDMPLASTNCAYCEHGDALFNIEGFLGMYCRCACVDRKFLFRFTRSSQFSDMVDQCNTECNDYKLCNNWLDTEDKLLRMEEYRTHGRQRISANDPF